MKTPKFYKKPFGWLMPLLVLALILSAGWTFGFPFPSDGEFVWAVTEASQLRTSMGDCRHTPGTICVEWCEVEGNWEVPQGIFKCGQPGPDDGGI
ncbi:MAG: hypothetical protein AAGN66_22365 [Acidobacteriota bacterium]